MEELASGLLLSLVKVLNGMLSSSLTL